MSKDSQLIKMLSALSKMISFLPITASNLQLDKIPNAIARDIEELPLSFIRNLPGTTGRLVRTIYWRARLAHLGDNVVIGRNVNISSPNNVIIEDNCWIDENVTLLSGPTGSRPVCKRVCSNSNIEIGKLIIKNRVHIAINVVIQAHGGVVIGPEVGVASGAKIYSLSHHYRNQNDPTDETLYIFGPLVESERQSMVIGPINLEEGSAVGLNSVILPGSNLAKFSWLGCVSVLSGSTAKGSIWMGIPAKLYKMRPGFK